MGNCHVTELRVVRCKNKLLKKPETDASANLHLNVAFLSHGYEHVAEVQLTFEHFYICSHLDHTYYEMRRAKCLADAVSVGPVFGATLAGEGAEAIISDRASSKPTDTKCSNSNPVPGGGRKRRGSWAHVIHN